MADEGVSRPAPGQTKAWIRSSVGQSILGPSDPTQPSIIIVSPGPNQAPRNRIDTCCTTTTPTKASQKPKPSTRSCSGQRNRRGAVGNLQDGLSNPPRCSSARRSLKMTNHDRPARAHRGLFDGPGEAVPGRAARQRHRRLLNRRTCWLAQQSLPSTNDQLTDHPLRRQRHFVEISRPTEHAARPCPNEVLGGGSGAFRGRRRRRSLSRHDRRAGTRSRIR